MLAVSTVALCMVGTAIPERLRKRLQTKRYPCLPGWGLGVRIIVKLKHLVTLATVSPSLALQRIEALKKKKKEKNKLRRKEEEEEEGAEGEGDNINNCGWQSGY